MCECDECCVFVLCVCVCVCVCVCDVIKHTFYPNKFNLKRYFILISSHLTKHEFIRMVIIIFVSPSTEV